MATTTDLRSAKTGFNDVADIFDDSVFQTWTSWTPSYSCSGSMTIASVTTDYAKYIKVGKTVHFSLVVIASTLGDTASATILITLPISAVSAHFECSAFAFNNSTSMVARSFTGTTTSLYLRKSDASAWTLGSGMQFRVSGTYQVA